MENIFTNRKNEHLASLIPKWRRMMGSLFVFVFSLLSVCQADAQVTKSNYTSGQEIVNRLFGRDMSAFTNNIVISQYGSNTIVGESQIGYFDNLNSVFGGTTALGGDMNSGIVLSSGLLKHLNNSNSYYIFPNVGVNPDDYPSGPTGAKRPGVWTGGTAGEFGNLSYDAAYISFTINSPAAGNITGKFVFASEEYPEYVGTQYNDVCRILVNGVNYAKLPNAVEIFSNNVNAGGYSGAFAPEPPSNPNYFVNNNTWTFFSHPATIPIPFNIEPNGFTKVLTFSAPVNAGINTIKIGVADVGDAILDAWLFAKAGSFTIPEPLCNAGSEQVTLNGGLLSNICPATTVNLNSLFTGTAPTGSSLVWFNNAAHTGSPVSNPGAAGAGTYYAFFFDAANNCFNTANSSAIVTVTISANAPLLVIQSSVCNGTTYSVGFNSNGSVTASAGTVSGNTVTGIPVGTNVLLTASSGCSSTTATVNSPSSCTNPPPLCVTPILSAGQGVCIGTGTYSVAFNVSAGAIVTASAGTISGNTIINIPIGSDVTITATSGACNTSIVVTKPADCSTPCATPGASFSMGICTGATYSINISNPNGATIGASAGTVTATAITGIAIGTNVTVTATAAGCTPQSVIISSPSKAAPLLAVQSAVCNGTTYSIFFNSNGRVTASAGTVSGNTVTGIPVGTNVILTATSINGCATSVARVNSPASCTNPPPDCVTPTLSAGQGVCIGTGTYSVAFNVSAGAIVTASAGTISGNTIINIPIGSDVTITATSGACNTSIVVTKPADCSTPCATPGASFSMGICTGATYSINISNPNGATIGASAGTVTATAITGIAIGTNVTVTATATGCTPQSVIINSPSKAAPLLTVQNAVCNGTTYSVSFSSNGIVTASAGTVSGNTVTGIPVGTNVILTATSINGCATSVARVNSPVSCTNPPPDCVTPTLSAGQGVCIGTGTYSVAFNVSAGATVTASAGTISGNTIINIPIGNDVTITATSGACNTSIVVTKPADCSTPCATPGASFSMGICTGTTYSINIANPNGATIAASAGTVTATAITGIPVGTNVTITATASGCTAQSVIISSPSKAAPLLAVQSAVCNGTTYSISFSSNGSVTASAGTVSGNTVTGIPVGTNVVLTAAFASGCGPVTSIRVNSPVSCTNPPPDCVTPTLSAGQGVCIGTGTYSVAFNVSAGATVTANAGTVSGNNIINIPIGSDVTITATSGACNTSIVVTKPADCSTPCATPGASFSMGICTGTTYSINIANPNGATIAASAGTVTATAITGIPVGTNVTITATASGCTAQTVNISSPSKAAPLLTVQSAVCNGTTYSVSFSSNGSVTASAGIVSGNTVTGIPVGTNVVLTATSINGCATSITRVNSPSSCTNPPPGCVTPTLSAGQGVCIGTGTYSVAFNVSAGATVTASAGTVSGNTIINIPIGSDVTITATSGACNTSIVVTKPADCSTPCATPGASFSMGICTGATYSINISNPNGATIGASAGTVTATAITGIAIGTNVTVTATAAGCTPQSVIINSPSKAAPLLTVQSAVCNGTTYSVSFSSNGSVTASAGIVSGNTVTGIPVGTNIILTATSINGCATSVARVNSPVSCTNPPPDCVTPTLSAGQGVCIGTGTYSVAFNVSAGATVTANAGTVSGNNIINIPIGNDVTITATSGACNTSIVVTKPADCSTPCATPGASFSMGICTGTTYSINIANPNGATIAASAGTVTATAITGIPVGTNVTITATASGCTAQTVNISSPSNTAPLLAVQSAVCNGTTYSISFSSNGSVTASAGIVSGNTVTGIPVGTNVVLTAAFASGCGPVTSIRVNSPVSCTNPPPDCVTPTLSAGQGVCIGTGTYSVAFNVSAGAIVTASAGTISGNTIINIPIGSDVTITATSGACNTSIVVTKPADCSTPCATPGASFSMGICTGTTYSINISNPNGATIGASAGTVTATAITGIPVGTNVTITATATGCTAQTVNISSPSKAAPLLTVQNAVCNGTTYSVSFSSNGIVTASAGIVSGNTVTGIPVGTNVILTATSINGCATSVARVNSPVSCTNPPPDCVTPTLSAGQGVCIGTGTYSVAFNVSAGAIVTASAGTVSGNTIINIPIGNDVTITATSGACNTSIVVTKPADCSTPCATPGASFSMGICTGATYSINISNPNGATIGASAGTVTATAITGIPVGTNVTITATASGCTAQTVNISSPSNTAPLLAVQSAVCNGTTYSISFSSNGSVTASAGTVSGNTVTGIPVGTNVVLTAAFASGCGPVTSIRVNSPVSCTNPPPDCVTPTLSAGQGVCIGTGTYSVAFNVSAGAIVTASAGTVSGNNIINIPIGSDVTITATSGACNTSIVVTKPADCSTPCATPGASFSMGICTGTTYSINIANPNGATIAASAGTVTATAITGIPVGTNVTITATASGCTAQTVNISSPSKAAPLLAVQNAVCNGTTYSVSFSSNGSVTASAGIVSGNTVTGIPVGTNVVLTATSINGCATSITRVNSPSSCTNPPPGCVTPTLSAGQGVCIGTGTYSVAFNVSAGATVTASAGTVSGNTIINIPIGSDVTITATSGACNTSIVVTKPADCSTPCATPGASFSMGICTGATYSINISNPNGATIGASAGTVTATAITGIAIGTNVTVTATATGCTPQSVIINSPSKAAPLLTVQSAVCNGTTYSVSFSSNGRVTASAGTVTGNTITGIPMGTAVILTSTSMNGCATSVTTVNTPTSCTNPPVGCTTPTLSAGQGVCIGTGTYSVAFNVSAGATVTASAGTVSGNTIINIPIGNNVTITAASGACNTSIVVTKPADCSTPCATPGASFSMGICTGTTYSINIANPNGATIAASAGTVTATAITGIPVGTNVTITATAAGCTAQAVVINSPSVSAPLLTVQSAVCNGTTYRVSFNSNGIVTASAGTISGNTVTGIPVGTNVILTAASTSGCATTVATVNTPASCTNPPVDCVTPTLSAGQGVCTGTGTYSVAFNVSAGATVTANAGTVSGNTIINIPIGSDVTITAIVGACSSSITVIKPADCSTPCITPGASFSMGVCGGTTYSINIANPNGATIVATAGTVSATAITGIPFGSNVTITATAAGCAAQVLTINAPNNCGPDLTPVIRLIINSMAVNTTRDFVVRLNEVLNNATNSQIAINVSVPAGYVLTFDNAQTTSNVIADQVYNVSNINWVSFVNSPSDMDLQSKPGFIINGNSNTVIGFKVRRTAAAITNSVGNIIVTIYPDPSRLYDTNNLNNLFSRIINAN